jgi:hypothetical protein
MFSAGSLNPGGQAPGRSDVFSRLTDPRGVWLFRQPRVPGEREIFGREVVVAASSRLRGKDPVSPNAQLQKAQAVGAQRVPTPPPPTDDHRTHCGSESHRTVSARRDRPSAPVNVFDQKRESRFMDWSESINRK